MHACMRRFQQRMPAFCASCLGLAPTDEVIAQHHSRGGRIRASQRFASQAFDRCRQTPVRLDGGEASREGARPGLVLDSLDLLPASDGQSLPASLVWRVVQRQPPSHFAPSIPRRHTSPGTREPILSSRGSRVHVEQGWQSLHRLLALANLNAFSCLGPELAALLSWRRPVVPFPQIALACLSPARFLYDGCPLREMLEKSA